jgi:hypothetical protein
MVKNKRWGKEFKDERNHKLYQEELIKRYELYLDLDWVANWEEELKQMNKNKKGSPYKFPDSMIEFQIYLSEKFPSRGVEAITKKLVEYGLIPYGNDHATINRRLIKKEIKFEIPNTPNLNIGNDGSGFKMTNSGEYKQTMYGTQRRKFAKVIITATKEDILEVDVHMDNKGVSEPKIAEEHIDKINERGGDIEKFYGDGAFDTKSLFNKLEDNNIESAIRIRKDASTKARGSLRRKREVKEFKKVEFNEWSKKKSYGHRWPMTEGHFSAIKRTLGENTRSKKPPNILKELRRKIWVYDKLRKYGRSKICTNGLNLPIFSSF